MDLSLHPYQQEAREAVIEALQTQRSTIFVLPTAASKTAVMAIRGIMHIGSHGGSILVKYLRECSRVTMAIIHRAFRPSDLP